ncbi:hypothetical protein Bca101_090391 [Brassica carinata]
MNLPSSTSVTSASDSDTSPENSPDTCEGCGSRDSWVTHSARFRCIIRFYCTHCLLRKHPTSFCPSCLAFYDSSPPHHSHRVSCSDCGSYTHIHCAGDDANSTPYRCPPCRDPDSFSFFRPIIDATAAFAKCEAERKGKDAAVAKKRAREALDDVIKLDEKAKSDIEFSTNRDQKPSLSPASTNSYQLKKPKADHPSVK